MSRSRGALTAYFRGAWVRFFVSVRCCLYLISQKEELNARSTDSVYYSPQKTRIVAMFLIVTCKKSRSVL